MHNLSAHPLLLLALALLAAGGCSPERHDQGIRAQLQQTLQRDDVSDDWRALRPTVDKRVVTVAVPPWLEDEAPRIEGVLSGIDHVKKVQIHVDDTIEPPPARVVLSQSDGGAWTLGGGLPADTFRARLVALTVDALQIALEDLRTQFTINDKFLPPPWLDRYVPIVTSTVAAADHAEFQFEANEITVTGVCAEPHRCTALNLESLAPDLSVATNFRSYASLVVEATDRGISVRGTVERPESQQKLLACLFEAEEPSDADIIELNTYDSVYLSPRILGHWCAVLRTIRPPLTRFAATLGGQRATLEGWAPTDDFSRSVLERLPPAEEFPVTVRIRRLDTFDVFEARCSPQGTTVRGTTASDETAAQVARTLRESPLRLASVELTSHSLALVDPRTVEAARLIAPFCHAIPDGRAQFAGRTLTLRGLHGHAPSLERLEEMTKEQSRVEVRTLVPVIEDARTRGLAEEFAERFADNPLTFVADSARFDARGQRSHDALSAFMREHMDLAFALYVHVDGPGSAAYHRALASERTQTILNGFYHADADDHRVEAMPCGDEFPVASRATSVGQAENTRIEMFVTGTRLASQGADRR